MTQQNDTPRKPLEMLERLIEVAQILNKVNDDENQSDAKKRREKP